jgi:hypothetical protein
MKALLIWENIPEQTYFLELEFESPLHILARKCAGKYANADTGDIDKLNEALEDANLLEASRVITGLFMEVICCGLIL